MRILATHVGLTLIGGLTGMHSDGPLDILVQSCKISSVPQCSDSSTRQSFATIGKRLDMTELAQRSMADREESIRRQYSKTVFNPLHSAHSFCLL
jgi:hypothetical protein